MSLKIDFLNPVFVHPSQEGTKLDPMDRLPKEMMLTIFSNLNSKELNACCLVSKKWKQIASDEILWKAVICRELAFGKEKWATYFGDSGSEPPLPPNIHQILIAPCPFWPGKKVHQTHLLVLVPQTVNGQPLTLKTLEELVKKPLQGHATQYTGFYVGGYTDPPTAASHWTLMTRDVIPNSRNKTYADQKTLVQGYAGYEIPKILDVAIAILGEYVRTGTRLYGNSPWTYARCQEKYNKDWQLVIGGFNIHPSHEDDERADLGVGGFRKF